MVIGGRNDLKADELGAMVFAIVYVILVSYIDCTRKYEIRRSFLIEIVKFILNSGSF